MNNSDQSPKNVTSDTEKRAIKCHAIKCQRISWRIIDGLMQRSTHKINTLPHPEITPTIISLPFNRAHFVKNELKQARVKILTVKRQANEVRSFQAILASSWDSNERRQSIPCRRGFHSFSCQILRCWRHAPPPFLPSFPSRPFFYFTSPGACFSKVPKLRVPQFHLYLCNGQGSKPRNFAILLIFHTLNTC